MRIGITTGTSKETLAEAVASIVRAEASGFDSVWRANVMGLDALAVLTVAARETSRVELGTAVMPTYPRHPHAMAQQAATLHAASGGRGVLGVGRSHQVVIETMFGLAYDKPITHMREYLTILRALLDSGHCSLAGKQYNVNLMLDTREGAGMPIMIGALMPKMLDLCGELCDGTLTWMAGPRYVEGTIVPRLRKASQAAGRKMPRVVVSLPVCVTDDAAAARELAARDFAIYGQLPVYRACLDAEGVAGPADLALVGTEAEVEAGLRRVAAAGGSDFYASVFGDGIDDKASRSRSYGLLGSLCGKI